MSSVSDVELGYLSGVTSAIQTQLNAKQAAVTGGASTIITSDLTISRASISNASGKVAVSTVTNTELGYLSGTTGSVQTQFDILSSDTSLLKGIVNFVSGSGNVLYTPSAGSNLPLYVSAGGATIAQFKHDGITFSKNLNISSFDVLATSLSGNCLTQIAGIVTTNAYTKTQIDTNLYTKTQVDNLLSPITTDTTNLKSVIYRTDSPTPWTGGLVIKYPQIGAFGFNNYLNQVTALFDVNDLSSYKTSKFFANVEATNYDVKCNTLSGNCLTQIAGITPTSCYTKNPN